MQRPERSFARPVRTSRYLNETVVEGEVVPERVLPTLRVFTVVRKVFADESVNVGERQHFLGRVADRHRRQRDVRVRRFLVAVRFSTGSRHGRSLIARDSYLAEYGDRNSGRTRKDTRGRGGGKLTKFEHRFFLLPLQVLENRTAENVVASIFREVRNENNPQKRGLNCSERIGQRTKNSACVRRRPSDRRREAMKNYGYERVVRCVRNCAWDMNKIWRPASVFSMPGRSVIKPASTATAKEEGGATESLVRQITIPGFCYLDPRFVGFMVCSTFHLFFTPSNTSRVGKPRFPLRLPRLCQFRSFFFFLIYCHAMLRTITVLTFIPFFILIEYIYVCMCVYVREKGEHFVGMNLRPEPQRGEKYLPNETFPSFLAQKTIEKQCFKL